MSELTKISEAVRNRDQPTIALDVFKHLDSLRPPHLPDVVRFNPPELSRAWRDHGAAIPEQHRQQFEIWLAALTNRSGIVEEGKRRLRSTMWAEIMLRGTEHYEYANMLAQFHREEWLVAHVTEDSAERERQLLAAVKMWTNNNGARR